VTNTELCFDRATISMGGTSRNGTLLSDEYDAIFLSFPFHYGTSHNGDVANVTTMHLCSDLPQLYSGHLSHGDVVR